MSLGTKIEHIRIATYNHRVSKRTFSFDYDVERNGYSLISQAHYNSSHSRSPTTMRKYLEQGYATEIVLESFNFRGK